MENGQRNMTAISMLYAEGDPLSREMVVGALACRYPGMGIRTAVDGGAGLELYRELRPEIVLTALSMPVMDGIRMAGEIRSIDPAAAIIAIAGEGEDRYVREAVGIGVRSFVPRQIDPRLLLDAVEECVNRIMMARELAEKAEIIRKLSSVVERSPCTVIITDAGGVIEYVNPRFTQLTGYSPEEVTGRGAGILKTGGTPPDTYKGLWETITSGGEWRGEFLNRKKGGEPYWEAASIAPVLDGDGVITHYVAVKEDISERKRSEEALRESEERLLLAIEASNGVVWDWDPLGDEICYFGSPEKMIGLTGEEIGNRPAQWLGLIHPKERERVAHELQRCLRGESLLLSSEYRVRCGDGSYRWVLGRGKVVDRSSDGRPLRMVGTITDIDETKQLEAELHQSRKMEAIGQLAGGVAHDFNNILTAIIGFAHLLDLKMAGDDPLRGFVGQIRNCADRAAELTQGLLAFGRKQVMAPKVVDLNEVIVQLHNILKRLINESIEMRVTASPVPLTVMADTGKLEQVLINLVTNARDAMPRGGLLVIDASLVVIDPHFMQENGFGRPGRYAAVAVSDTGRGIDPNARKRIFDPFFTTKEVGKGTGLGLSIVYGIVKQHDGHIGVSSDQGRGTTFTVYIPLVEEKANAREVCYLPPPRGGAETVLLAEDDAAVLDFHGTLLQEAGYKVIAAADGEEALDSFLLHENEIALLILDVVMPRMGGNKVANIITNGRQGLKVLLMSGYTPESLMEAGVIEERSEFMMKPVDPAAFLRRVREILDR